jgi:2-dehydro-3-deoxyphosphogluconate aldolase/(4S)-4-hydroxy-2-oxoglutarate aldolase
MTGRTNSGATAREGVAQSIESAPIVGVVRTPSRESALDLARTFISGGLELVEVTFTVPEAAGVICQLLRDRKTEGPPWIGAGTVTTRERALEAIECGAEFIVTPNVDRAVAETVRKAGLFLVIGALTATEICSARALGADLVKVYPLPPVGGPDYLSVIRQPLDDVPILAAGGFEAAEIPRYRAAGAVAFGIGAQILGNKGPEEHTRNIAAALAAARGES